MKRTICTITLAAALICCFAGCSGGAKAEKDVDLAQVMTKISETAKMPEEIMNIETADDLMDYYGIDATKTESYAVCINAVGYQDEIVMIKAASDEAAKDIEKILNDKLAEDTEAMKNYSPEQYAILQNSHVDVNGRYISMFVSADSAKMIEVYNSFFA